VRAAKKDRDKCKELRLFQSMVIERIRESNAWSATYHKSFDREIYLGQGAESVPRELITYARCYMESLPLHGMGGVEPDAAPTSPRRGPIPSHSTVYEFLKSKLNTVLQCSKLDKECAAHAKTVTGYRQPHAHCNGTVNPNPTAGTSPA